MAATSSQNQNPHILVFPYPAQGHMIPMLDLIPKLASRGISITILITPKNLSFLDPLLSKASSSNLPIKPLIFPFPNTPLIPPGIESVQSPIFFHPMTQALSALYDNIYSWFQTHPSPPIAILSDFFLGWTQNLATHLQIPRIVFSPSGAFAYSHIRYLWLNMPNRDSHSQDPNFPLQFPELPNSPTFLWYQIAWSYRKFLDNRSNPVLEFFKESMLANYSSWGSVFNTCYEIEGTYLDHLRGKGRTWAVGPLLPEKIERGGSCSVPATEILEWLDRQEKRSVLYVCFGSQTMLSSKQMKGLAEGLEKSGVGFLWCVKEPAGIVREGTVGILPDGFEERTKGRGWVIRGWSPQVLILNHGSVGAFLSHCGWNSTLEAVVSGVPVLAWPMSADQFVDARLLVEMGVAVTVCQGDDGVPEPEELTRAIGSVIRGDGSMMARAVELRSSVLRAIEEGGSSCRDLDDLVGELRKLCKL